MKLNVLWRISRYWGKDLIKELIEDSYCLSYHTETWHHSVLDRGRTKYMGAREKITRIYTLGQGKITGVMGALFVFLI